MSSSMRFLAYISPLTRFLHFPWLRRYVYAKVQCRQKTSLVRCRRFKKVYAEEISSDPTNSSNYLHCPRFARLLLSQALDQTDPEDLELDQRFLSLSSAPNEARSREDCHFAIPGTKQTITAFCTSVSRKQITYARMASLR